jgi:polyisoprenoid-binding protein YceI
MKYRAITLALAVCLTGSLALASDTWTVDSSTSTAGFAQGSSANQGSVGPVIARVTGKVKLDAGDLGASTFDLSIYPPDEYWRHALSASSDSSARYVPGATDQTLLTFKSKRVVRTASGQLKAIGDITLTRVARSVTATPTEAYAGPVYGRPFIHTYRREVAFVLPGLSAAPLSASLTSATLQSTQALEIAGSVVVSSKEFPELLSAQDIAQNKDCQFPSAVGEDYRGVSCTGTPVTATWDDSCPMPASVGEDYSGSLCSSAAVNQTTIVLDLKLLPVAPASTMGMLSGKAILANR